MRFWFSCPRDGHLSRGFLLAGLLLVDTVLVPLCLQAAYAPIFELSQLAETLPISLDFELSLHGSKRIKNHLRTAVPVGMFCNHPAVTT